jgi:hypothetical protein
MKLTKIYFNFQKFCPDFKNFFLQPTEMTPVTVSWHPMVHIAVINGFFAGECYFCP